MNRRRSLYQSITRPWNLSPSSSSSPSPSSSDIQDRDNRAHRDAGAPSSAARANDHVTHNVNLPVTHLGRTRSTVHRLLNRSHNRQVVSAYSGSPSSSSSVILSPRIGAGAHVPASSTRLTPPTLEQVLEGTSTPPFTRATFTAFLSNNHCLESLEFYIDAKQYHEEYGAIVDGNELHIYSDGQRQQLCRSFERIISVYIQPCSPREINLPSDVRDELMASVDKLNQRDGSSSRASVLPPSPGVLDVAVQRIYELLEQSCFLPWISECMSKHRDQHQSPQKHQKTECKTGERRASDVGSEDTQQSTLSRELLHMSSPAMMLNSTPSTTSYSSSDSPNRADMYGLAEDITSIPIKTRRNQRNLPSSSSNTDFTPLSASPDLSSSVSMASTPSSSPMVAGLSSVTDDLSRQSPSVSKGHKPAPTSDPLGKQLPYQTPEPTSGEEQAESLMTPPTTPPSRHCSFINPLAIDYGPSPTKSTPDSVPVVPTPEIEEHHPEKEPHPLSWKGLKTSFRTWNPGHRCRVSHGNLMSSWPRRSSVLRLSRTTTARNQQH